MLYYVYIRGDTLIISITFTLLEQMTQPWLVHVYLCVCVYQTVCVFDVAVVYLCGSVAIWSYRLFVLGRMDTGGKDLLADCCLCDSLPPVSALTHRDLAVWTWLLLLSFPVSFRTLVKKLDTIGMLVILYLCVFFRRSLLERQTPRALGSWWPSRQTGLRAARSPGQQQRCTCQQENISKP